MLPIIDAIRVRRSCRNYEPQSIQNEDRRQVVEYLESCKFGPLGSQARFLLVSSDENDRDALKGLGTYGIIKGAPGFVIGAVLPAQKNLEDFGYLLEDIVLMATRLGLGTCWLGGFFTRSSFARKIDLQSNEMIPAVISIGYPAQKLGLVNLAVRASAGSDRRLPWDRLFFDGGFHMPLAIHNAGLFAEALERVRLGPSASNRQPWRVVRVGSAWHFYLQRTPGYGTGLVGLLKLADLQRVDIGIAMCHFERSLNFRAITGRWHVQDPGLDLPDRLCEYVCSWLDS